MLFMMSDDANKLRTAGQPASPGPNQTLLLELDTAEDSL